MSYELALSLNWLNRVMDRTLKIEFERIELKDFEL